MCAKSTANSKTTAFAITVPIKTPTTNAILMAFTAKGRHT